MSRNPDNTHIWQDARVWTADGTLPRPTLPTTAGTAVNESNWFEFGILDGEDGFGEERSSDETEHFGWGLGLIKIGTRNFKLNRTLSALEDNVTTRSVLWPGSSATKLYMPKPKYLWLGFDTVSDLGLVERLWTVRPSRLTVPNNNRNESDITKLEITANIFANGSNELFDRQATDGSDNLVQLITLTGATGGVFVLAVNGYPTSSIAYNAAAATVQTELEALASVGSGNVTVTGSAGGPYTVTFGGALAGTSLPLIVANGGDLTGSSPTITVA